MKIYTRTGDAGETALFGGGRVAKDHLRVEAYGSVDELNATLGLCTSSTVHEDVRAPLEEVQRALFSLGAYLATPEARHRSGPEPTDEDAAGLEALIDRFEAELTPLERFVLPGGTSSAAAFHLARTVCRRAERCVVRLHREEAVAPAAIGYLNRLSDLLFVLARLENRRAGVPDVEWEGTRG